MEGKLALEFYLIRYRYKLNTILATRQRHSLSPYELIDSCYTELVLHINVSLPTSLSNKPYQPLANVLDLIIFMQKPNVLLDNCICIQSFLVSIGQFPRELKTRTLELMSYIFIKFKGFIRECGVWKYGSYFSFCLALVMDNSASTICSWSLVIDDPKDCFAAENQLVQLLHFQVELE